MTHSQRLVAYELRIVPTPAGTTEVLDQDGNLTVRAWFDGGIVELKVLSRFTVELLRDNPFDFLVSDESLGLPLWYPEPLSTALAPYRSATQVSESVNEYARTVADDAGSTTLQFLTSLNRKLFESCGHLTRLEGPPWTSDVTLSTFQGSCRDLAVLFCDACRVMGIAARFVSGYECASAGQPDAYMHAWAEVYLPGAGWRGYDPSRGLVVANTHVAVAAAFHHDLASPVAGAYCGGCDARMAASLQMSIDSEEAA